MSLSLTALSGTINPATVLVLVLVPEPEPEPPGIEASEGVGARVTSY